MKINPNAPLVDRKSIVIHAPRAVVWRLLTDINSWPTWHAAITRAEQAGPLAADTVFHWTSGGMGIVSTIRLVEPEQRFGWTGKALGTSTEHIWHLEEIAEGTRVTTEESMSGWLIYPVKLITPGFLTDALESWLAALKYAAEPQPVHAGLVETGAVR